MQSTVPSQASYSSSGSPSDETAITRFFFLGDVRAATVPRTVALDEPSSCSTSSDSSSVMPDPPEPRESGDAKSSSPELVSNPRTSTCRPAAAPAGAAIRRPDLVVRGASSSSEEDEADDPSSLSLPSELEPESLSGSMTSPWNRFFRLAAARARPLSSSSSSLELVPATGERRRVHLTESSELLLSPFRAPVRRPRRRRRAAVPPPPPPASSSSELVSSTGDRLPLALQREGFPRPALS